MRSERCDGDRGIQEVGELTGRVGDGIEGVVVRVVTQGGTTPTIEGDVERNVGDKNVRPRR